MAKGSVRLLQASIYVPMFLFYGGAFVLGWVYHRDHEQYLGCKAPAEYLTYAGLAMVVFANMVKSAGYLHPKLESQESSKKSVSLLPVTDSDTKPSCIKRCRDFCSEVKEQAVYRGLPFALTVAAGFGIEYNISKKDQTAQGNETFIVSVVGAFFGLLAFAVNRAGAQFSFLDNALEGWAFALAHSHDSGDAHFDVARQLVGVAAGGASGYVAGLVIDFWIVPVLENKVKESKGETGHGLWSDKGCYFLKTMLMFAARGGLMELIRTLANNVYLGVSHNTENFFLNLASDVSAGAVMALLLGPAVHCFIAYGDDKDKAKRFFIGNLIFAIVGNIVFQILTPDVEKVCDGLFGVAP